MDGEARRRVEEQQGAVGENGERGEVEKTVIRKMAITGFTADSPNSGYVPFNFNYTAMASFNYEREVSA